jgi:predicted PurR-regulated permease PerM
MPDNPQSPKFAGRTIARWASFIVLIASILIFGAMFYRILYSFFVPLFFAALLVVIFQPVHFWIQKRCQGRNRIAAAVSTAAIFLIGLLPAGMVFVYGIAEGITAVSSLSVGDMPERVVATRKSLGLGMPQEEGTRQTDSPFRTAIDAIREGQNVDPTVADDLAWRLNLLRDGLDETSSAHTRNKLTDSISEMEAATSHRADRPRFEKHFQIAHDHYREFRTEYFGGTLQELLIDAANPSDTKRRELQRTAVTWVGDHVLPLGGATASFAVHLLVGICIAGVSLYFFLADGPAMIATIMRLSPLEDAHEQELLGEFSSVSRAVVLATLLSALAQAACAGLGFAVAGLEMVFLLTMLTAVFAMIPFVGAAAVWLPSCLWLFFFADRPVAAILLAIYGAAVVSMIDNLIKPLVLHGQSRLHPLLALLSVLGGVQALGPIGILVGPMVVVFLQTLLNILHRELQSPAT